MVHGRHTDLRYGFMNATCREDHTCICERHRLTIMGRPKSPDCVSTTMSPERVFTPEKAREIGEALGLTVARVKSRLHDGRKLLRERLAASSADDRSRT